MKKITFLLITYLSFSSAIAQNTWIKYIPGYQVAQSTIINDSILTFGNCLNNQDNIALVMNRLSQKGEFAISDTLNHTKKFLDSVYLSGIDGYGQVIPILKDGQFTIPLILGENNRLIAKLMSYPNCEILKFNFTTTLATTRWIANKKINNRNYGILRDQEMINKLSGLNYCHLIQFTENNYRVIKEQKYGSITVSSYKQPLYENIFPDNQNVANLFLQILDRWDFRGDPTQYEGVIQKIDTNGNLIWECRPAGDQDSINTSNFKMIQIENGNIICSWLDLYFRPNKNPKDPSNNVVTGNLNATLWYAEIDYQTGKKIWTKNNRQFLDWKMGTSQSDFTFSNINEVIMEKNGIIWCGFRFVNRPSPQNYSQVPFLYKTDFHGNSIWYREYDLWTDDNTDRGFVPYSVIKTSDKGFLLSGEYQSLNGNPHAPQAAMLLKLDSNGCFEPGCNAFDKVVKIKLPEKLCKINPNPAQEFINIEFPKNNDQWELKIFDLTGKEVFESKRQLEKISTKTLQTGTYLIHLTNKSKNNTETHKVFVEPN
jgi:hypothetical protein